MDKIEKLATEYTNRIRQELLSGVENKTELILARLLQVYLVENGIPEGVKNMMIARVPIVVDSSIYALNKSRVEIALYNFSESLCLLYKFCLDNHLNVDNYWESCMFILVEPEDFGLYADAKEIGFLAAMYTRAEFYKQLGIFKSDKLARKIVEGINIDIPYQEYLRNTDAFNELFKTLAFYLLNLKKYVDKNFGKNEEYFLNICRGINLSLDDIEDLGNSGTTTDVIPLDIDEEEAGAE